LSTRRARRPAQRKQQPSAGLATAVEHPAQSAASPRGRRKTLVSAVDGGTEREILVALRAKLAAAIDGGVAAHAMPELIRQFRQVDSDVRLLDELARQRAEADDDGDDADDADEQGWDESRL
jgi:hypothetical protein